MPVNKATGTDRLSAKLLKIAAPAISPSVSRLINHCISTCSFPSKWKVAKVSPIYKNQGSKKDKQNYRPISVLPVLSKLYERHIYEALYAHLTNNNLLHGLQSGFRKRHSTETALIRLLDQLLFDLDRNNVSGLVLVDYSKAFDLIDHQVLIAKLNAYGVNDLNLRLFNSYLSGRYQYVEINGFTSAPLDITHGVPQGSILGPLLFLIFINDLPSVIPNSTVDIYADDTTLSSSSHYSAAPMELEVSLQKDTDNLCKWTDLNHMVLNASKTKSVFVTGQRLKSRLQNLTLAVNARGVNIEQVSCQKMLGIIFDEELTFKQHVEKLSKRLSQKIGLLKKMRKFLPMKERKLFYNAIIKPVMMYGSSVWSCCSTGDLQKIFKLQKRAARVILETDTTSRTVNNFTKLGWIPFYDDIKINKCTLIYKRLHGEAPHYIEELLSTNNSIHRRQTRHGQYNLVCPKFNYITEGGKSFTVTSIKLWNSLPHEIKKKPSLNSFKSSLRKFFIESYKDIDRYEVLM